MGLNETIAIGQKVVDGITAAHKIGKKIVGVVRKILGHKAEPKIDVSQSDSYLNTPKDPPRVIPQPNQLALPTGGGIGNKIQAGRELVKSTKNIKSVAGTDPRNVVSNIKREKQRIKNIAQQPSKRQFRNVAKEQQFRQQALLLGSMSDKQKKRYFKKAKKRSMKRRR